MALLTLTPEIFATYYAKLYREDKTFRGGFDRDPKEALGGSLASEGGLSRNLEIKVLHNSPDQMHIVIPSEELVERANPPVQEFSDEAMESVSGGYPLDGVNMFSSFRSLSPKEQQMLLDARDRTLAHYFGSSGP